MPTQTPQTMTVAALIARLQDYPEDMLVMFAYPSGDYWNTTLAGRIEEIATTPVKYSDYHSAYKVVGDPSDEPLADDQSDEVLILQGY